jgi:hypothetical protein
MKRSSAKAIAPLLIILAITVVIDLPARSSAASPNEPVYQVVWPLGKWAGKVIPLASSLDTPAGKTVCNLIDREEVASYVEDQLKGKYSGMKFIPRSVFEKGFTGRSGEQEVQIDTLSGLMKEKGCDAVVAGIGI